MDLLDVNDDETRTMTCVRSVLRLEAPLWQEMDVCFTGLAYVMDTFGILYVCVG